MMNEVQRTICHEVNLLKEPKRFPKAVNVFLRATMRLERDKRLLQP